MHNWYKAASTFALLSLVNSTAQAILISADPLHSTERLGLYEAEARWDGQSLNIDVANISDPNNGGYLTGFLLRLPENVTFNNASTDSQLTALLPDNSYLGSPFGSYDYGFALDGNFLGGGKPSKGIGVGETAHFSFTDFNHLPPESASWSSEDFEHFLLENEETQKEGDTSFLARFRGFENGGSDKVPSQFSSIDSPPPPPGDGDVPTPPPGDGIGILVPPSTISVPEPSSWLLMLIGMAGLSRLRKKKRS